MLFVTMQAFQVMYNQVNLRINIIQQSIEKLSLKIQEKQNIITPDVVENTPTIINDQNQLDDYKLLQKHM
jgi:DNA polymerase III delta subunit